MSIRKATVKDAKAIVNVIKETVQGTHQQLYASESIGNILNIYRLEKVIHYIESYDYFVLEIDERIVGCVLVKEGKMRSLYVLPSFGGKGYGRELVEVAERCAKEAGYKEIWLWSSLVSYDFYIHMGYEFIEDVINEKGVVVDKAMKKSLEGV